MSTFKNGDSAHQTAGLKVNVAKSLFCAHEIEYLGCILTRDEIKPQPKKVQVIIMLKPPNNVRELRHFLGMVQTTGTCGQDIVKCWPLSLTWWKSVEKQKPPKRTRPRRNLGSGIRFITRHSTMLKAASAKETVLAYPDFLKPFEIYTVASSTQLGTVIAQDNRPMASFSRKLSRTQQK
jgi:Trp operon repressor